MKRKQQKKGAIVVPWKLLMESPDSVYNNVKGEVSLQDGDEESDIIIKLPQVPLPQEEDNFTVVLEKPTGFGAKLGKNTACDITINNNYG